MLKKKSDIYNLILIVIAVILSVVMYSRMPELVPTHWNVAGEIDGYSSKLIGAFMAPVFMIVTWLGMKYMPKIDPRKSNYEKFIKSYSIITCFLVSFFLILHIITIMAAMGQHVSVQRIIPIIVGILFIVIGNYLPKTKSNFFYGIKTPWTISSDVSWKKTHILGGRLFVAAGFIIVISTLAVEGTAQIIIFFVSMITASIVPVIASYFYAKSEK